MSIAERFNQSGLSRFINSSAGRVFRVIAGVFDICYVSAIFGGPFSGEKIREAQRQYS